MQGLVGSVCIVTVMRNLGFEWRLGTVRQAHSDSGVENRPEVSTGEYKD